MTEKEDTLEDLDIQQFKLVDGTDIVAYINSTDGVMILLERPMSVNCVHQQNGYETYFFTKYMPFSDNNIVKLNSRNVISVSPLRSEIKEKYIRAALNSSLENDEMDEPELDDLIDTDMEFELMPSISKCIH